MNKLRGKFFSKFLLMLIIAGIGLFNFSSYTNAFCELSSQEEACCCSTECSSVIDFPSVETISSDCLCISEFSADFASILHKALFHSSNSNNTTHSNNLLNIHFVKLTGFADTPDIKSSNSYIKLPDNSSYILKDVYLFNSILRI